MYLEQAQIAWRTVTFFYPSRACRQDQDYREPDELHRTYNSEEPEAVQVFRTRGCIRVRRPGSVSVIVASLNANKRLGTPLAASRLAAWITERDVGLLLVQEPWRGSRAVPVALDDMLFIAGDADLATWARREQDPPSVIRLHSWWQTIIFDDWQIHSVHLDAYAGARRVHQLHCLEEGLDPRARNIIVGDFNLAPRDIDGRYGTALSSFTSRAERAAFTSLLVRHGFTDSTAADPPVFTIERIVRGLTARFRCDLALIPAGMSKSAVKVMTETREGSCAFTDHAGILCEVQDVQSVGKYAQNESPERVPS